MYLSPGVAPPTYTPPPPSPHSYPQRHRGAARRSLCHSFRSRSLHSSTFLLFPSFFYLSCSNFSARLPFPTYTQLRRVTPTYELTRSFHVALRINSRLLLSSFFAFLFPSFPLSLLSCAWRCFSIALTGHQRIPTTTWHPNPRRIVASRRVTSRRLVSRRVASRRFFALSPTSPLAYCFREFDEILPRDANGPPCTFFDSTVGHLELN